MAKSIGSLTFDRWLGEFQASSPDVLVISRPGVTGLGVSVSSPNVEPTQVETVYVESAVNCTAHKAAIDALKGTTVSATDAKGTTRAHTTVMAATYRTQAIAPIGTKVEAVICQWLLLPEA